MIYRFEDFSLDTDRRELFQARQQLAVEPKVFDLLAHLIAHRNRVVTKDELIAAIWDSRIVSESALTTCINAARAALGDSGETQRVIKTLPRKGLRFVGTVSEAAGTERVVPPSAPQPATSAGHALLDRPSVAALPFTSIGTDPEQEYFSDGVVEEIITALSQMRWLLVIARNSSFTYKGREVDVQQVGRELGARYVLTGSVRKAANRVRLTAQLVDAETRANFWAGHFEGNLDDIFELQDQVARNVVGAIIPKLEGAEIERTRRKVTENLNAYDYYLRALAALHQIPNPAANDEALSCARKAFEIDPSFASAYGLGASCYCRSQAFGWMSDRVRDVREATSLARQAADLGRDDAVALAFAGQTLVFVAHDIETGAALIDRALLLNTNSTVGWHWSGWVKIWSGDPDAGVERASHAMRLSPLDPYLHGICHTVAHGHFFASRHEEAAAWAAKSLSEAPRSHPALRISAASHAFRGDMEQARSAIERLRRIDPNLRISNLRNVLGPYRPDDVAKYQEGLRRAGLPE
ncbi:MAG: winged helix-turn-helix domain-containing protein [Rhodospirillales bacterium]|nr:winged helix-turn-helix domain-containing protein [Rhodospirillales bacterium]